MKKQLHLFALLGLFWCFSTPLQAQQRLTDSLKSVLKQNNLSAHQRVMTMCRLARVYSYGQISKADSLNKKAIQLATMIRDTNGLTFTWARQVGIEGLNGHQKLAKQAVDSSLFYAQKASPLNHGIALYMKGWLQNYLGEQDDAIKSWQQAQIYLNEPKGAKYQANIYNLKFGIYSEHNNLKKATHYAHLALKRALQSKEPTIIVAAWQINGTNYLSLYQKNKEPHLLDSAIYSFKQSIKVFRQKRKWISYHGIVILSALNLADIQINHFQPAYKKNILANVGLALEIAKSSGSKAMEASSYEVICRLYSRTGQLNKAEQAMIKAKNIVDSMDPPDVYLSLNVYLLYSMLKEKQGDNTAALKYYKKYVDYYQKEFNSRKFKTIQKLEAKYESKQKTEKLVLLRQRNAAQKKQNTLYIIITIIAIIGLIALFVAYKFKTKYARQREKFREEEAAKLRAEQQLAEQKKEQLQKELMAGKMQVEHKNELLQNLKEKLLAKQGDKKAVKTLEKIINEEIRIDQDFEHIRTEFKEIHPQFFERLQEAAGQELTQLDLKYCGYIYMQLTNKQIATLLNITPKSVRMAKYRLKQKLNLAKEEKLDRFIKQLYKG